MCSPYSMIASTNPGGKPIPDPPPKPGKAPPPDMVNDEVVGSQADRQRLSDEAQAAYDKQDQPINWRDRRPSKDDPFHIRWARMMSGGPKKGKPGNWEYLDDNKYNLKLNPDGSAALGMGKEYYDNLDNWYSKEEWDSFYGDDSTSNNSANDDGVNL